MVSQLDNKSKKTGISRRACINWVMLIYFASGTCSLIDEVVWVRMLKLTLGNTVYATSIVVSMFMGGLALGALIMGRYSDRVRNRLRLYALLETLVTISALSLPFALKLVDGAYVWFYRAYNPSPAQLLIVQVIISAAMLLVPSMLMGSTLPLLGRFVTALEKEAGHLVGKLYALNTLGAAVGCFVAGFVLIRAIGVMGTLYTAAVLNLLVAFGGWFLSRFSAISDQEQAETAAIETLETVTAKKADGRFYLLIFAFFMSGLISIGYELLWMRSIVHLLGGFTYVFSAVLTVYLLGNVIGAGIGSRLVKRLKTPAIGFAVTLSLLGLWGIFYPQLLIFWTSKVLPYANPVLNPIYVAVPASFTLVRPLAVSLFLFLVPSIVMGIGFPIALQAWTNHMHKVGRSTGTAYGANTIGAVIGGIVTGFVFIPLLGLQISISILGLIGVWIAGVMCLFFARSSRVIWRSALLGVAVILTIFTVKEPSNLFDVVVEITPARQRYPAFPEQFLLLSMKEGVTTTVSVHRDLRENALYLYTSGLRIAGDTSFFRSDQKMLGHFGVLLNKDAKKILSVGFGSGESTACLAMHKLERVDCAEIAPEVVDIALQFFRHINLGDRLDDEINMIYMDAKNYLHLTDVKYDAIVNDSIHPRTFAENASLYTKEYYESAREHLNDKGLFISWIPTHNVEPTSVLNSIIGTQMDVFPYVTLWYMTTQPAEYYLVVGSVQPQYFSPKHIENVLLKDEVRKNLSDININNSMDVLSCYIADKNDLRKVITDYSLNSDYHPFVEFNTESRRAGLQVFTKFLADVRSDSVYDHIDWTGFSEKEKEKWLTDYQQLYKTWPYMLAIHNRPLHLDKLKYSIEGLRILPNNPALLSSRRRAEEKLFYSGASRIVSGETSDALALANMILKIYPESATAWMIRGAVMADREDMKKALEASEWAVKLTPDRPDAHFNLGFILFRAKQFDKAVKEYREALRLKPDQPSTMELLARVLTVDSKADFYNPSEAVRLAERACELTGYKQAQLLDTLATAYAAAGRFPEAVTTAERSLDIALSEGQPKVAESIRKQLLYLKSIEAVK